MQYQTLSARTKRIVPHAWLFANDMNPRFIGPLSTARTGPVHQVELDLGPLAPEDLFALARTMSDLAVRIEREADRQMEREAQRKLF